MDLPQKENINMINSITGRLIRRPELSKFQPQNGSGKRFNFTVAQTVRRGEKTTEIYFTANVYIAGEGRLALVEGKLDRGWVLAFSSIKVTKASTEEKDGKTVINLYVDAENFDIVSSPQGEGQGQAQGDNNYAKGAGRRSAPKGDLDDPFAAASAGGDDYPF